MMRNIREFLILSAIILLSISLRSYYALSTNTFQGDESYYVIRQVHSISDTGLPLYHDDLSYSGKDSVFNPGYYYLLYLIGFILPEETSFKIVPIILSTLSIIAIYLITRRLTSPGPALFASFISIFIPIYTLRTTNTLLSYVIVVPLMLFCLQLFAQVNSKNKATLWIYIILMCILNLISANVFILILCLLFYLFLLKIEEYAIDKTKRELIIFTVIFTLWVQFLIYKKALIAHGQSIIWQNIPFEMIINYFSDINILIIIYYVGVIPFFYALFVIYRYALRVRNEELDLYLSLTGTIALLLLFRLIKLETGLIYLGFCFVIFYSIHFKQFLSYVEKTKFARYKNYVFFGIFMMFILTSIAPTIALLDKNKAIQENTIQALEWIKENTQENSIVLGTVYEGNLISGIAQRRNIIDQNFILAKEVNQRVKDIRIIYTSPSIVKALELLNYYNIDYILVDDAKKTYGIKELHSNECMELIYEKEVKIYKIVCKVERYE